jgi:hypothetical protein
MILQNSGALIAKSGFNRFCSVGLFCAASLNASFAFFKSRNGIQTTLQLTAICAQVTPDSVLVACFACHTFGR